MAIDIEDVTRRVLHVGSGTGPYNFTFNILAQTDIAVYQDDTLLTLTTDYTVTINADGTGSVTTVASQTGYTVTIVGARAYARLTDYATGGDFTAATMNDELDSILILIQQIREALLRSVKLSDTTTITDDLTIPEPAANQLIGWNSGATALENKVAADISLAVVTPFMETVLDDTTAADARTTLGAVGLTGNETVAGNKTFSGTTTLSGTTTVSGAATFSSTTTIGDAVASGYTGFKNKIIGGDFTTNPWQRGTSFAGLTTGSYTADRWRTYALSDAVVSVLKTADAPTAIEAGVYTQHCLHADVTTADVAIANNQYSYISQRIEGYNSASLGFGQSGTRYVTLSFWHKHTKTGAYCVGVFNSAGNRSYVAEYTQAVTDTWEKATVTIPVDTTGTWLYDNGIGLDVFFTMASGTDYHASAGAWNASLKVATSNQVNALDSTSNNFKIALVQLEAGQTATSFETRSVGQERALCQRYYYRNKPDTTISKTLGVGFAYLTTGAYAYSPFPVTMRTSPTAVEQSGTLADYQVLYANTGTTPTGVPTFGEATTEGGRISVAVAAVLTVGEGLMFRAIIGGAGYLGWSAEL